jgi:signal transduction histidine kinase
MVTEPLTPDPTPDPVSNPALNPTKPHLTALPAAESALSRSSLLESVAELERQLEQQRHRQNLIDQLTSAIRSNRDLNQVYTLATECLVRTMQVRRGLLLLFKYIDPRQRHRQTGEIAKTKATVIAESWHDQARHEMGSTGSAAHVASTEPFWASSCGFCQPLLTGATQVVLSGKGKVTAYLAEADPIFQMEQLPALLMLPLESQGTTLGCLVLQHDQIHDWSTDDIAFVRLVAAQLSTAIIQTRSFQQVQSVVQERTAQLQRSLEVQAKLYEKTRQQVDQLRKMNEEREEFLSTISHELLTPLTSMSLAIRMLRQGELDRERQLRYLDILEQQCVRETHLINDLLALRKLENLPTAAQMQKLDLRQLIQTLTQSIEPTWQDKEQKLSVTLPSRPLIFYSDSDSLHRILIELLTNARKYADPGSTIELVASCEGDLNQRQIVISIRNIGAGIQPDELPYIFDKFRRGHGATKQAIQGTGLGLALVKSLVEHLDGTITADSRPLEADSASSSTSDSTIRSTSEPTETSWETWFTITLPQTTEGRIHAIA